MHQLQGHQAVVHPAESRAAEVDVVDFELVRAKIVHQRQQQFLRILVQIARAIDQVDAEDAERILIGAGAVAFQ